MHKLISLCLLLAAPTSTIALAQQTPKAPEPPTHYYHLDFVVQEVGEDGKPTNSRAYATTASTSRDEESPSIRTGTRVPVVSGSDKGTSQVQYIDVGISIDVRAAHEVGTELAMQIKAEVTSIASLQTITGPGDPIIHQNRWAAMSLIPVGKPTVVFTSDNLENKGRMQLVVTATLMP